MTKSFCNLTLILCKTDVLKMARLFILQKLLYPFMLKIVIISFYYKLYTNLLLRSQCVNDLELCWTPRSIFIARLTTYFLMARNC